MAGRRTGPAGLRLVLGNEMHAAFGAFTRGVGNHLGVHGTGEHGIGGNRGRGIAYGRFILAAAPAGQQERGTGGQQDGYRKEGF